MKNFLKKRTRADGSERRAELEREAADQIESVASRPPAEVSPAAWGAPTSPTEAATEAPAPPAQGSDPAPQPATAPSGRRLTVQERVAARQLQNH